MKNSVGVSMSDDEVETNIEEKLLLCSQQELILCSQKYNVLSTRYVFVTSFLFQEMLYKSSEKYSGVQLEVNER